MQSYVSFSNEWPFFQSIGEAVKGRKQQCAAKGRSRKVLGDIGNLANVEEVEVKPNRPITR